MPYCIAIGFLDQKAGLQEFTEQQLERQDLKDLTAKIDYSINPDDPYPAEYAGWIDVTDNHGQVHSFQQPCMRGGKKEPMSQSELADKFTNNLLFAGLQSNDIQLAKDSIHHLFYSEQNIRECLKTLITIGGKR